jgi:hypothetical protein
MDKILLWGREASTFKCRKTVGPVCPELSEGHMWGPRLVNRTTMKTVKKEAGDQG